MTISRRFLETRFAAGVVGSLPRPLMVKEMLPEVPGPESVEVAQSAQMDAAVRYAITIQELAGLDLVSDGEWRRALRPVRSEPRRGLLLQTPRLRLMLPWGMVPCGIDCRCQHVALTA